MLATTATANARVTADVAEQLGDALVLRGPLDRDSLRLAVLDLPDPAHRLAWLADHLDRLPGSGIVYTLTVAGATETADFLRSRGFAVASYTGQVEDAERRAAEQDLLDNKIKALVATSALGMGFDKPDLGFVVHLGAPPSPIAYYQQVGRAGRAVEHAEVVLLPGPEDAAIWRYFASLAFPPEDQVRSVLANLSADRPMSTQALEPLVDLRRNRLEMMLKVLDVDGAVRRARGGWLATGEPWTYDTARLRRVAEARSAEQQTMIEYAETTACRMEFLRRCLDDPEAMPVRPVRQLRRAAFRCRGVGGVARRRRRVPGPPRRRDRPEEDVADRPGRGRRLAQGQDRGRPSRSSRAGPSAGSPTWAGATGCAAWSPRRRPTRRSRTIWRPPSSRCSSPGRTATDAWRQRPVGVVAVGSRRHPAAGAKPGRAHRQGRPAAAAGPLDVDRRPGGARGNSAQRVRRSTRRVRRCRPMVGLGLAALAGPVLLVDDLVDSGWTMALAGRALRRAGAEGGDAVGAGGGELSRSRLRPCLRAACMAGVTPLRGMAGAISDRQDVRHKLSNKTKALDPAGAVRDIYREGVRWRHVRRGDARTRRARTRPR